MASDDKKQIDVRQLEFKLTDFFVEMSLFIEQEEAKRVPRSVPGSRSPELIVNETMLLRIKELRGRTESTIVSLKEDQALRDLKQAIERRKEYGY